MSKVGVPRGSSTDASRASGREGRQRASDRRAVTDGGRASGMSQQQQQQQQQLSEVVERVASQVVLFDPHDLRGLADMHTALQEIARLADESNSEPNAAGVAERATAAERMIERVILREIDDANAALAEVVETLGLAIAEGDEAAVAGHGHEVTATPASARHRFGGETCLLGFCDLLPTARRRR